MEQPPNDSSDPDNQVQQGETRETDKEVWYAGDAGDTGDPDTAEGFLLTERAWQPLDGGREEFLGAEFITLGTPVDEDASFDRTMTDDSPVLGNQQMECLIGEQVISCNNGVWMIKGKDDR